MATLRTQFFPSAVTYDMVLTVKAKGGCDIEQGEREKEKRLFLRSTCSN